MNKRLGAIFIIIAAVMWGVDGVVLTPRLYHLEVPVVVFLMHAIAFALMLPFFIMESKQLLKLDSKDWSSFIWIAIFGGAIGTMAITKALFFVNFNQLSVILILQKLQPLFAIVLAMLLLHEMPRKDFYLWAALSLVGSYLLTFGLAKPVLAGNNLFVAAMLSLLAAFAFGSSTVFGKRALNKTGFRMATYLRFGLTTLIMLAIVTSTGFSAVSKITTQDLTILLIIAFTTGGLAILIYYYGLKEVPASKSTIYELAFPITAVLLDYFINRTVLSIAQYAGAAILILSMTMITWVEVKKADN